MTESYDEARRKYFDEIQVAAGHYRQRAFDYEAKAIEFANNTLRVLAYLNGGALIATPTAVALFHTDMNKAKIQIVVAFVFFIASLFCVVVSQGAGFFTMARRGEAQTFLEYSQVESSRSTHFPQSSENRTTTQPDAKEYYGKATKSISDSNFWRLIGLVFVWSSLFLFILGCCSGAWGILNG